MQRKRVVALEPVYLRTSAMLYISICEKTLHEKPAMSGFKSQTSFNIPRRRSRIFTRFTNAQFVLAIIHVSILTLPQNHHRDHILPA
jgi:hypothetical protein